MAELGYVTENKHTCPFLVAESLKRESIEVLFGLMSKYTGVLSKDLLLSDMRGKYLELLLKLLVPAALAQNIELDILKR